MTNVQSCNPIILLRYGDDTLQQLSWTVANHVVAPKVRRGGGFLVAEILHHLKFQRSLTILWDKTSYQVVQDFRRENIESWEKHQIIWNAGIRACCMLLSHPPREGSFQHVFLTVFASKGSNNQRMKSKVVPLSGFLWIWSVAFFFAKKNDENLTFLEQISSGWSSILRKKRFQDCWSTKVSDSQIISIPCICKSHILHVRTNSVYTYFVYIYIYIYIYIHVTHHRT